MRPTPLAMLLVTLTACDAPQQVGSPSLEPQLARFGRPDIVVAPGQSIQAALDAAPAGSLIHLLPGVYEESIEVTKAGIRIVGRSDRNGGRTVLQNPGGASNGISVRAGGDQFTLSQVTLRGYDRNGIFLINVRDFLLSDVIAEDNGRYGLYPVMSSHGVIERSRASGHSDAGIYVGQASDITIRNSVAYGNVVGVEISNSTRIKLLGSELYGNTAGVLVALLPGRRVTTLAEILVSGNRVYGNNRANFAEPGDLVGAVPAGSGILVIGADATKIEDNVVSDNGFVGIGVGSSLLLALLAGVDPALLADIEPDPDGVRVRGNDVRGNGLASTLPLLPAVDLFWDGSGSANCWTNNRFDTSGPAPLPAC